MRRLITGPRRHELSTRKRKHTASPSGSCAGRKVKGLCGLLTCFDCELRRAIVGKHNAESGTIASLDTSSPKNELCVKFSVKKPVGKTCPFQRARAAYFLRARHAAAQN